MSLYKVGTITTTNASNIITGVGTLFLANVTVGDDFKVSGENAEYNVISVDSNTQIQISPNYAGTTASGLSYSISRDFTQNHGLTEVQSGDTDWPFRMTETLRKIDSLITNVQNSASLAAALSDETGTGFVVFSDSPAFTTQISTPKIVTAGGGLEITPVGNAHVVLQGSGTGKVGIGTLTPTSKIQVVGLPTYADNTAALAGGLTAGAFYRTSTGVLMVAY